MAIKKSELYSSLWAGADALRGGMDASQYKDYVLVLLFLKYVSDKAEADPYALYPKVECKTKTYIDLFIKENYSTEQRAELMKEFQSPLKEEDTDIKELTERLRNKIGIFIKHRLKKDVAKDLPSKYDDKNSRIKKIMPDIQLERYKIEIENANNSELSGVDGRNQKLRSLWAVRDISDHPYLLDNQILNFTSEELIATSAYYENKFNVKFKLKAELVNRQQLIKMIASHQISIKDISKIESQRMQRI
jgi:hypothetical protein